jgi:hypothetical protein
MKMHLCTMGLFEGDVTCIFRKEEAETVQHIICCCEAWLTSALMSLEIWMLNQKI